METTYKCEVCTCESSEEAEQSFNSTSVNNAALNFMPQKMTSALDSSSVEQTADINKATDTRNKLLDSIMTAPTLVWTSALPKGVSNSEARHHIPAGYIQIEDLHAMAQASLIAQTQEIISKQLESEAVQHKTKVKAQPARVFSNGIKNYTKVLSSTSPKKFHESSQSSAKILRCPYKDCSRTFSWPAHLKYHQLTHTGEKNFTCDHAGCGKSFYTKQRLLVHNRTHTGDRPFECTHPGCDKSFTTAQNLANHQRIHTGERPYACDYDGCTRRFAEISSLRKHSLTHTGKKPFHCEICGKTFTQSGSRRVHWKRHQLKAADPSLDTKDSENTTVESGILVLHSGGKHISQYQDIQGSDCVVFSQSVSSNVVTVTTQSSNIDCNHIQLSQELLPSQVVNPDSHQTSNLTSHPSGVNLVSQHEAVKLISQHKGVNFVVLAQPHEVISLSSTLQQNSEQGEPTKLLDPEEIAQSQFNLHTLANSEEGKEFLTESSLVPQEVSEVVVGDCIESGEQETEISVRDRLIAQADIEMSADSLISHRGNERTGEDIISQDDNEIIVGDCITLGEGDNEGSFMSEGRSETCVTDSEMSVRDSVLPHRDREISIGDVSHRDAEMSVRHEREMSVRDSVMPQAQSEMDARDSLVSHRESEMCVRESLMSQRESEMGVRDSLMSHGMREICVEAGILSQSVMHSQQSLSEHSHMSSSSQSGKEMVMDPMMESDEEGELAIPSGYHIKDGHLS